MAAINGFLSAIETQDTATFVVVPFAIEVVLSATEAQDTAEFIVPINATVYEIDGESEVAIDDPYGSVTIYSDGAGNFFELARIEDANGGVITTRGATWISGSGAIATPANDVFLRFPTACTIVKATIMTAGGSGSCSIDVWKDSFGSFPPTVADSICAAAKPTIVAGIKYEDATLTGWTTTIAAGDVLAFHLESSSTFTSIFIQLDTQI